MRKPSNKPQPDVPRVRLHVQEHTSPTIRFGGHTMQIRPRRSRLVAAVSAAVAALALGASALPAQANPDHVDPASLDRGANPRIPYLVGNTIHDGDRRIRVRGASTHVDLWTTDDGYAVVDRINNDDKHYFRITTVSKGGERKVIARPRWLEGSAVSPQGTRMAFADAKGDLGTPVVVTVVDPETGAVKGRRSFERAQVVAVTARRVLLTRPGYRRDIETWWWNYRRDTIRKISDQYAIRADLRQERVVLAPGTSPARCHRVAPLSKPSQTLWRSCGITPHAWSPNGELALSTHIYFDVPGTDRWVTVNGRTGEKGGRVNGRLDWDVAWESNRHFLTMAQGDDGNAAVIRCTPSGSCERASRVWDLEIDTDAYYVAPPVLLSSN